MQKEPATIVSAVIGLITAVIGLLVAFNIDVSPDQQKAIISTVSALAGVIVLVGPVIRQFVYSPDSVKKIAAQQYEAGEPPTEPQPPIPPPAEPVAETREEKAERLLDELQDLGNPEA